MERDIILLILIGIIIGMVTGTLYTFPSTVTDLEIYTEQDIIYVNDKTVTFENTDEVYTFKDNESLKLFIVKTTIEHIRLNEQE